jgi:hypothetical protein
MSEELKAIKIIRESIVTHLDWAEYFEKYPNREKQTEYKNIGDAVFHRQCIKNYTEAIDEIADLTAKLKIATEALGKYGKHEGNCDSTLNGSGGDWAHRCDCGLEETLSKIKETESGT